MFVKKLALSGQAAWTPAADRDRLIVMAREEDRYAAVRKEYTALIVLWLADRLILVARGAARPGIWPSFIAFGLCSAFFLCTILRARALYRHIQTTQIESTPCLCLAKDAQKRVFSQLRGRMYGYAVTVRYGEDDLAFLWADPDIYKRLDEQAPALLLRMRYKDHTYYDISPGA